MQAALSADKEMKSYNVLIYSDETLLTLLC